LAPPNSQETQKHILCLSLCLSLSLTHTHTHTNLCLSLNHTRECKFASALSLCLLSYTHTLIKFILSITSPDFLFLFTHHLSAHVLMYVMYTLFLCLSATKSFTTQSFNLSYTHYFTQLLKLLLHTHTLSRYLSVFLHTLFHLLSNYRSHTSSSLHTHFLPRNQTHHASTLAKIKDYIF
jgi:hypothetical protein